MEYLVLRKFKSFGVFYAKGSIVPEEKIRNVRLKLAEGKIVRAVETAVPSSPNAAAVEVKVPSAAAVPEESTTKPRLTLHK